MAWPGITDFSEAVQNPGVCFRGTELEAGTVSLNRRGMPLLYSGAFACVYRVAAGGRTFAVRCFTREVRDQEARYNRLGEYLINVLPPSFVNFRYLQRGISLRGSWYPVVRMEWVEGQPLSGFVGSALGDPDALRRLAAQWRGGPAASLRGLGIAHNDLQHGNVMVQADGRIRLVDYDGMFLPAFKGERSPELGHKNYQHPLRTAEDYGPHVDNFPSLVIYLSLLAVASDPGLWSFFNDDNLIFTRHDYADPAGSALFGRLKGSADPTVAKLAERLEECCSLPVAEVPDLEEVLRDIPPVAAPRPAAPAPPTPAAPAPPAAPAQAAGGYRQHLQARGPQPARPAPAAAVRPPARAAPVPVVRCPACRRINSGVAAHCVGCGAALAGPTAPPGSPAGGGGAAVGPGQAPAGPGSGDLRKVALGVAATVVAVAAALAGAMAIAVAVQGW